MTPRLIAGAILLTLLFSTGCASSQPRLVASALRTLGNAALVGQTRAFDGRNGRELPLGDAVRQARAADVVLFGEEHNNLVCNELEAQILAALAASRPTALAMEFFETDTQAALDSYLQGTINESDFRRKTRQGENYWRSHRPLIEICRAEHMPVIAANAPRELVRRFRRSGEDYATFCQALPPRERLLLPAQFNLSDNAYFERFKEVMGGHAAPPPPGHPTTQSESRPSSAASTAAAAMQTPNSQPAAPPPAHSSDDDIMLSMFKAQSLWDDSMAETIANHRARYGDQRVMLVVGVFHVQCGGGTALKLRERRPHDRIATIIFRATTDLADGFQPGDRDAGDVVIYGLSSE